MVQTLTAIKSNEYEEGKRTTLRIKCVFYGHNNNNKDYFSILSINRLICCTLVRLVCLATKKVFTIITYIMPNYC